MTYLYAAGYEKHGKYLQKVGSYTSLIHTEHGQIRADNEKFSLYDNNEAREVTVTFRGLEAEDSGRYVYGIKDVGPYTEWSLAVKSCTCYVYTMLRHLSVVVLQYLLLSCTYCTCFAYNYQ